ncbi:catalase family protein [Pseudomonas syringae pv. syringae]|nr:MULTISPECIES: catalase family protein [Pseudomonas]AKF44982.1 Catalase [Pseudomonas syringae pv. syringae B301D]AVB24963.1 catalase [Pseudomonas syringae pv. syringae]EXL30379.1 Catalase-like heme-binding protein [Pseudomonas syringae pv. syringae str. B301D-R]KPB19656.1 Catalase-like heme-binding protein [Pseudomonas syringae pv. syringae]KTB87135.1 catalase [Pseudomonas syringae ICMP 13102]
MTTQNLTVQPLPFQPSFEVVPDDEAQTSKELVEAMHSILETTYQDTGHAIRSVHAKAHGLLHGQIQVYGDLPEPLAQGAFARPGNFPVVMRFSTNPGDILDDKVSTPRGLAIKLVGVEGPRLPGSAEATTQDFVMQNAKAFTAKDPKAFLKTLKLLAKTTDKAPSMKRALSAVLRGIESVIESAGGESGTLRSLGGHPMTHILGETFYTVVPFLYGPYYAKLSVVPVCAELIALTDKAVDLKDNPDGLREAVKAFFLEHDASWEVRVQLATDLEKMPIEDASAIWPEDLSPYVAVARIDVPRQSSWSEQNVQEIDEAMAFSPWHGLEAHRPLGGVMRVRKPAYEHSAGFRSQHNGCPMHEPRR